MQNTRNIKVTTTKIKDKNYLISFPFKSISQRSGSTLIDNTKNIKPGNAISILVAVLCESLTVLATFSFNSLEASSTSFLKTYNTHKARNRTHQKRIKDTFNK